MANPTSVTAEHEIQDFSGLALRVKQIQNEAGVAIVDGEAAQQAHEADLAVTDVTALLGGVKVASAQVDASGGGTAQTTAIATVPAHSLILAVHAAVDTQFNGDTTTTLEVGVSGNIDKYIDTMDFDPSSASAEESNFSSSNADQNTIEYTTTAQALIATWTNVNSASAGAVTVTVYYVEMGQAVLATELATAFAEVETTLNSLIGKLEDAGILADS